MKTGERIRDARKKAGLTQKQLGERIGVSGAMIGQYETEIRKPKYETILRIAEALGVKSMDLMPVSFTYTDSLGNTHEDMNTWDELNKVVLDDIERIKKKALELKAEKTLDSTLIEALCRLNEEEIKYVQAFVDGLRARRNIE